jgi:hypothetical protein
MSGRPDEFVEKVAQNVAQPVFCQNQHICGTMENSSPKFCATYVTFETLPIVNNGPKFAQSGHTECRIHRLILRRTDLLYVYMRLIVERCYLCQIELKTNKKWKRCIGKMSAYFLTEKTCK